MDSPRKVGLPPQKADDAEAAAGPGPSPHNVIDLEKHFRAKQIRNYRRPRQEPGALVLIRIFHPDLPA